MRELFYKTRETQQIEITRTKVRIVVSGVVICNIQRVPQRSLKVLKESLMKEQKRSMLRDNVVWEHMGLNLKYLSKTEYAKEYAVYAGEFASIAKEIKEYPIKGRGIVELKADIRLMSKLRYLSRLYNEYEMLNAVETVNARLMYFKRIS